MSSTTPLLLLLTSQEISTLREIISSPPSQVDATAACVLANTLNGSSCPHLKRIGLALDIVFRDRLFSTWFQAFEWERCLKDFLMDDISMTLYGNDHYLLVRSDLREVNHTRVYVTPYILYKF